MPNLQKFLQNPNNEEYIRALCLEMEKHWKEENETPWPWVSITFQHPTR